MRFVALLFLLSLSLAYGDECISSAEIDRRLARLEKTVAELHAAVSRLTNDTTTTTTTTRDESVRERPRGPHAALADRLGAQWVEAQPSEATLHFMFGLWDGDASPLPQAFEGLSLSQCVSDTELVDLQRL
jgi:hypothetical protein